MANIFLILKTYFEEQSAVSFFKPVYEKNSLNYSIFFNWNKKNQYQATAFNPYENKNYKYMMANRYQSFLIDDYWKDTITKKAETWYKFIVKTLRKRTLSKALCFNDHY